MKWINDGEKLGQFCMSNINAAHKENKSKACCETPLSLTHHLYNPCQGPCHQITMCKAPTKKFLTIKAGLDESVAPSEVSDAIRNQNLGFHNQITTASVKDHSEVLVRECFRQYRGSIYLSSGGNISERLGRFLSVTCCNPKPYNIHIPLSSLLSEA